MKRFNLSAGAVATAALAAALVAGAAFAITTPYGTIDWLECIGSSGCAGAAHVIDQPMGLTISDDQSRVFVASNSSDSVDIFTRDSKSGTLSQQAGAKGCVSETGDGGLCGDGRAMVGPVDVISREETLYVASSTSAAVAFFAKDPNNKNWIQPSDLTGCVSETGTGGLCTDGYALTGASSIAINANSSKVFVGGTDTIATFERNKSTGALKEFGCVSPTGLEGPGCTSAFVPGTITDITVSQDKKSLYAVASGSPGALLEFSVYRGHLTEIGCINDTGSNGCLDSPAPLVDPVGLQLDQGGKSLYVAANGSDTLAGFTRNNKTGLLTPSGCYNPGGTGGCTAALGLADPHGVRVCENRGCVLVSAGDGIAAFNRSFKTGLLSQPGAPFVPCFNLAGSGGCSQADGLGGAMGIDSIGGGIKQVYVAGSTSDAVSEFHLH
jgi:DNA-binding beta-propeller fold protein YncE